MSDDFAGQQGQCPSCGAVVYFPGQDPIGITGVGPHPLETVPSITERPTRASSMDESSAFADVPLRPESPDFPDAIPAWPEISRPPYKLYSPDQVGLAAFLGGPVGASLLLALNYSRLGQRAAAWVVVAICFIVTVALAGISLASPASRLLGLPLFLFIWMLAKAIQGRPYQAHRRGGGKLASSWNAAGFGLVGVAVYIGLVVALFPVYEILRFGSRVDFDGGDQVYYAGGATEADARALGAFLRQSGYFEGRGYAVRVARDGNRIIISYIVQNWLLNDAAAQQEFRLEAQQAALHLFGGQPVEVQLCDEDFRVKKRM